MATAESVKAKINNLIAKANAATGKSDADLTSGINSLIDGFGKSETIEIFDGTINIESGFTTISGLYEIDEQKAYDLLQTYGKVKTFNVDFSAGGSGKDMGDSRNFTSMTFDGTYGFIKYNDKAAFAMNGGFAEYNNNYGDGNGARVQFEEGTECRKEFKELFLSIADEYAGANLISFTVDGTSYQAEEGMTWGEWVESEYNNSIDKYRISGDYYIYRVPGMTLFYISIDGTASGRVLKTNEIIDGYVYSTYAYTASND